MKSARPPLPCVQKLIAIFALSLAMPFALNPANAADAAPAPVKTTLRVVSYNIHAGKGMDGQIDLPRIAEVLRRLNADAILLQEVDMDTKRSGGVKQAAELANLLGMRFYFAKAMDYGGGEYGNAILSRHPFARAATQTLTGGAEQRSAGIVEITLPPDKKSKPEAKAGSKAEAKAGKTQTADAGVRVMLVVTHLDARKSEVHEGHVREISTAVAQLSAKRPLAAVIFGGDFNATETSPIWDVLTKECGWTMPQKQGATKAARATFPSTRPGKEIDWFLYRASEANPRALAVLEHKVVSEPVASDHCPVLFAVSLGSE